MTRLFEDVFAAEPAALMPLTNVLGPRDTLELAGMLAHLSGKLVIDLRLQDPDHEHVFAAASLACEEHESALADAAQALLKQLVARVRMAA
ncbi:MAG: hypothetical protein HY791_07010 [Deltaproteobacteria bacterium]|nr:hypothetical protein [Deltaproteobacteria bacterium]